MNEIQTKCFIKPFFKRRKFPSNLLFSRRSVKFLKKISSFVILLKSAVAGHITKMLGLNKHIISLCLFETVSSKRLLILVFVLF